MKAKSNARHSRKLTKHERAQRVLKTSNSTLTLYSAYLVVLVRLVVILFRGDFPHLS